MKKILLFSFVMAIFGGFNCFAATDDCPINNPEGCGYYKLHGDVEKKMCLKDGKSFEDLKPGVNINDVYRPVGADCDDRDTDAVIAKCVEQTTTQKYEHGGSNQQWTVRSCSAKTCKPGTALWLHVEKDGKTLTPYGRCRTYAQIMGNSTCDCSHCKENEVCVEHTFTYTNGKYGETEAYADKWPCVCVDKCEKQYKGNENAIKCCKAVRDGKPVTQNSDGSCSCNDENKKWNGTDCVDKDCADLWPNNPEARACCEAGKQWNETEKKCECGENEKWVWDPNTNTGKCEPEKVEEDTPVDDGTLSKCYVRLGLTIRCANGKTANAHTNFYLTETQARQLKLDCASGKDVTSAILGNIPTAAAELYTKINNNTDGIRTKLEQKVCGCNFSVEWSAEEYNKKQEIEKAKNTLLGFFSYANDDDNKSVWKDAEGNFNTARLASDLTAGVVLGTVGGVVSGVVIKKKQVEKGFNALHCVVGGQTVADWGDTFNVGLR